MQRHVLRIGAYAGVGGYEGAVCRLLDPVTLGPITYHVHSGCALDSIARNEILVGLDFMHAFKEY